MDVALYQMGPIDIISQSLMFIDGYGVGMLVSMIVIFILYVRVCY